MKITKDTTLTEFFFYLDTFDVTEEWIDNLFKRLEKYPVPELFNTSFNDLKFRQLIDLQLKIKKFEDMIFVAFDVVYGLKKEDIIGLSAFDCLRFALFTKSELERITKLFKAIEYKPSAEEERAGIGNLSHGFFGTIDWYARRMNISNHDEVAELKWTIIYKCQKIDFDNNRFEKRYRDVVSKQNKAK